MWKKWTGIALTIFGALSTLTGISDLAAGINARGFGGVNYGRVVFPALILLGGIILWKRAAGVAGHAPTSSAQSKEYAK